VKSSTHDEQSFVAEFRENPDGFMVVLKDGRKGEVKMHEDMPEGRRLKVRGVRGWVSGTDVDHFVIFTVSINPDYLPGAKFGPPLPMKR
jgi:hypothetical protein